MATKSTRVIKGRAGMFDEIVAHECVGLLDGPACADVLVGCLHPMRKDEMDEIDGDWVVRGKAGGGRGVVVIQGFPAKAKKTEADDAFYSFSRSD